MVLLVDMSRIWPQAGPLHIIKVAEWRHMQAPRGRIH